MPHTALALPPTLSSGMSNLVPAKHITSSRPGTLLLGAFHKGAPHSNAPITTACPSTHAHSTFMPALSAGESPRSNSAWLQMR